MAAVTVVLVSEVVVGLAKQRQDTPPAQQRSRTSRR